MYTVQIYTGQHVQILYTVQTDIGHTCLYTTFTYRLIKNTMWTQTEQYNAPCVLPYVTLHKQSEDDQNLPRTLRALKVYAS